MLNAMLTGSMMNVSRRKAAEVFPFLETYIARKVQQIAEIEQVVERYEKKRLMEERTYQSMSPIRRMLSGKKPDHHLAVEYIHYVKRPLEQVRKLRAEVDQARAILNESKPTDMINLPDEFVKDLL